MQQNRNFDGGIILIDKPEGITSQTAVNAVRKAFNTKQVGHTGTLDPMATGLLCVLVGRAVKASEYAVFHDKRYEAVLRLGIKTDTQDVTGTVLSSSSELPDEKKVLAVCDKFVGEIEQVPPMYSALKVDGQKLCDLARSGKTVERQARPITIFSLDVRKINESDYSLSVHCSSGTYIRTLCEDIGDALGCGGTMAALRRTSVGSFDVKDAYTIDALKDMKESPSELDMCSLLLPLEQIFELYKGIHLGEFHEKLIRSGCAVDVKKLGIPDAILGERYRIYDSEGLFFALGEIVSGPDCLALKSIKLFNL